MFKAIQELTIIPWTMFFSGLYIFVLEIHDGHEEEIHGLFLTFNAAVILLAIHFAGFVFWLKNLRGK
jgi:hypothetical protein